MLTSWDYVHAYFVYTWIMSSGAGIQRHNPFYSIFCWILSYHTKRKEFDGHSSVSGSKFMAKSLENDLGYPNQFPMEFLQYLLFFGIIC